MRLLWCRLLLKPLSQLIGTHECLDCIMNLFEINVSFFFKSLVTNIAL